MEWYWKVLIGNYVIGLFIELTVYGLSEFIMEEEADRPLIIEFEASLAEIKKDPWLYYLMLVFIIPFFLLPYFFFGLFAHKGERQP